MTAENPSIEVNANAAKFLSKHMGKRNKVVKRIILIVRLLIEAGTPIIWNKAVNMSPNIPEYIIWNAEPCKNTMRETKWDELGPKALVQRPWNEKEKEAYRIEIHYFKITTYNQVKTKKGKQKSEFTTTTSEQCALQQSSFRLLFHKLFQSTWRYELIMLPNKLWWKLLGSTQHWHSPYHQYMLINYCFTEKCLHFAYESKFIITSTRFFQDLL